MARQQDLSVVLYDGVSAPTIQVQEGTTSGSYVIGDLVKMDTTGRIILATNGIIAGIACMDYTGSVGSAGDTQFMELINFNALYLITTASATATAQAHIGEVSNLTFTAGEHSVATPTGAAGEVYIVGIYPGDLAVAGGRLIVRFNASDITEIGD